MRIVNFLLALLFMAFASLQVNDPDPALWILIYGSMSVISVMAIFEFYSKRIMTVLAACFLLYCYFLWPGILEWLKQENKSILFDDLAKMEYVYVEESREFLGLTICLIVIVFYFFRSLKTRSSQ